MNEEDLHELIWNDCQEKLCDLSTKDIHSTFLLCKKEEKIREYTHDARNLPSNRSEKNIYLQYISLANKK